MDSKILAIIAVAVLAIGGATAFVMMQDSEDGKDPADTVVPDRFDDKTDVVMIYGNANRDGSIDSDDLVAIQKLMDAGKYDCYADANLDGKIDSEDVGIVEKIISNEKTVVYYQDSTDGATSIEYPVTSIMGVHQNILIPLCAIGAVPYMDGFTMASNEKAIPYLTELYKAQSNVNTSYNVPDPEKLGDLKDKPKHILTYFPKLGNEGKLGRLGFDVMHLAFDDTRTFDSAMLTVGCLLDLEEGAKDYLEFNDEVKAGIKEKILDKVAYDDRIPIMCAYMTNCIAFGNDTYTPLSVDVGARPVVEEGDDNYRVFNKGDEWIYKYDVDRILYFDSWDLRGLDTSEKAERYAKASEYFIKTDSYEKGGFITLNSSLPSTVLMSYIATALYGDLVGEDFGDNVFNAFMERFFEDYDTSADFDAAGCDSFITYDMVKGESGVVPAEGV